MYNIIYRKLIKFAENVNLVCETASKYCTSFHLTIFMLNLNWLHAVGQKNHSYIFFINPFSLVTWHLNEMKHSIFFLWEHKFTVCKKLRPTCTCHWAATISPIKINLYEYREIPFENGQSLSTLHLYAIIWNKMHVSLPPAPQCFPVSRATPEASLTELRPETTLFNAVCEMVEISANVTT